MTELEKQIKKYQDAYYNDEPLISDAEFDLLMDKLRVQNPNSTLLNSIGKDSSSLFPKEKHTIKMGSQQKAANEKQFKEWYNKQNSKEFIVEHKLDGLSLALYYNNGILEKAVTRGDGTVGDNVIANIKMPSIPKNIPYKKPLVVRGEIVMFKSIKEKYFPQMSNCRNGANGTLKQKNGTGCEHLNFIAYDINLSTKTERDKLLFLCQQMFNVVDFRMCSSFEDIISYRNKIAEKRNDLDWDIDGIVVKCQNTDIEDLKRDRPEHQIAFKFELEYADTKLLKVEFNQNGKTFTPVAHIEPVELCGTIVKQASFHNMDILDSFIKKGMDIGSIIRVVKRGEIIPYIEEVLN